MSAHKPADPDIGAINPTPTEEEAAAIVAAITLSWPRPAAPVTSAGPRSTRWRFSGRWWNKGNRNWR